MRSHVPRGSNETKFGDMSGAQGRFYIFCKNAVRLVPSSSPSFLRRR